MEPGPLYARPGSTAVAVVVWTALRTETVKSNAITCHPSALTWPARQSRGRLGEACSCYCLVERGDGGGEVVRPAEKEDYGDEREKARRERGRCNYCNSCKLGINSPSNRLTVTASLDTGRTRRKHGMAPVTTGVGVDEFGPLFVMLVHSTVCALSCQHVGAQQPCVTGTTRGGVCRPCTASTHNHALSVEPLSSPVLALAFPAIPRCSAYMYELPSASHCCSAGVDWRARQAFL